MRTELKTTGFDEEQQHKAQFVADMNAALLANGEGRYSHLADTPLTYAVDGFEEFVVCGTKRACVTGDSLTALMTDVVNQLF